MSALAVEPQTREGVIVLPMPSEPIQVDSWAGRGNCRDAGVDFFTNDIRMQNRIKREYCFPCPVRAKCLEHALKHHEDGIWGGTTFTGRRGLRAGGAS